MSSGKRTYVNFPFLTEAGKLADKGERLAASSTATIAASSWPFDANVPVSLPAGFAINLSITYPEQTWAFPFAGVVQYDDGNTKPIAGNATCLIQEPTYSA